MDIIRESKTCGVHLSYVTGDPEDTDTKVTIPGDTYLDPEELRAVANEMLRVANQIDPPKYATGGYVYGVNTPTLPRLKEN